MFALTKTTHLDIYEKDSSVSLFDTIAFSIKHNQTVTYNSWGKVSGVSQTDGTDSYSHSISYGPDLQRVTSVTVKNNSTLYEKFYWDDYEERKVGDDLYQYYYVYGADGLAGLHVVKTSQNNQITTHTTKVFTDNLGSIVNLRESRNIWNWSYKVDFDEWGNRKVYTAYSFDPYFDRGYTGHEHLLEEFGLINMNGRMYDPNLGRFLSPDNYIQSPSNTQSYNRYSYCLNNPLKYTDPDGESIMGAVIIGAVVGTYMGGVLSNEGTLNPTKWNFNSLDTWCYMACGLFTGAMSGALGGYVASSGIPMANTLSIMGSSLINSVGAWGYTGGQTDITMSLGFASYNFTQNSWGCFGKKGNSMLEDIGYGFGALANIPDIISLFTGGENVFVNSASTKERNANGNKDWWGHSSITRENGESLVSIGPPVNPDGSVNGVVKSDYLYDTYINSIKKANTNWPTHFGDKGTWSITLNNVSTKAIAGYTKNITRWDLLFNSCVGHATRSLWRAGIPVIYAFHPHMLNAQLLVRQIGIYSSPYLYQLL